jgi:hypothetical protein
MVMFLDGGRLPAANPFASHNKPGGVLQGKPCGEENSRIMPGKVYPGFAAAVHILRRLAGYDHDFLTIIGNLERKWLDKTPFPAYLEPSEYRKKSHPSGSGVSPLAVYGRSTPCQCTTVII